MPTDSGVIVSIEQNVVNRDSGVIASIEQDVQLKQRDSGVIVSVEQNVRATDGGIICEIEQSVRDVSEPVKEWDAILTIGGKEIDHKYITGQIHVQSRESDAALMTVTLQPDLGLQDLTFYQGKLITLDIIKDGKVSRIYSGKVDIPEVDIIDERITLRCTNTRKELDNALPASLVDGIGHYSSALFSESDDQADELSKRLETVEACLDYDPYLKPHFTYWQPKTTPDFTIDDANIYLRDPKVFVTSRGRIVNRVDIDLDYQYQRLRHRERNFQFDSELTACEYDAWGLPPSVQMLRQAIEGAGWPFTELQTVGLDPGGSYNCYGSTVYYSPISRQAELQEKKDADGNVVKDSNGNPVYEQVSRETTNYTDVYATSATWKAATRFSQNINERVSLSIQAPQSIAQYGEVKVSESFGVRSEFDDEDFANFSSYSPPPSDFTLSANGDYIKDADSENGARSQWNQLLGGVVHKALAKIRGSHRDNYVNIQVPVWPEIDLRHTVEATGGRIKFKGKVREISHYIDVVEKEAYTELEIALSRSIGTASPANISITRPTVEDATNYVTTIKYGTHTIPLNGTQNPNWTGYILKQKANVSSLSPIGLKTPVAMVVDTPDIDDASRNDKEVITTQIEEINIRNDLLEITFNG